MEIKEIVTLNGTKIDKLNNPSFEISPNESLMVNVYSVHNEKVLGFGGALTQSSAYNYSLLAEDDKKTFIEKLVGDDGLRYNMFRLTTGSSDFSVEPYCYLPDENLEHFSIDCDKELLIPFVKDVLAACKTKPFILASAWSAPGFMKTNGIRNQGGHLKEEYYDLYAEYIIRFIKEYKKEGIIIDALTIQNEPKATQSWESCVFTVEEEIKFARVLKRHLDEKKIDVLLLCWDHNKERLFYRADKIYTLAGDVFAGSAFHWYSGDHFNAISAIKRKYPKKITLETEFCKSYHFDETDSTYAHEILNNINCGANGIIEWNVLLDKDGGPYHDRAQRGHAGCDAPLRLDDNNQLTLSRIYYEMYMFSHYVDQGAMSLFTSSFSKDVEISAFQNPNGEIIVNILNNSPFSNIKLCINEEIAELNLQKGSLTTLVVK